MDISVEKMAEINGLHELGMIDVHRCSQNIDVERLNIDILIDVKNKTSTFDVGKREQTQFKILNIFFKIKDLAWVTKFWDR